MSVVRLPANGWIPRHYQLPPWRFLESGGKRACIIWPRRHGKDLTAINWVAWASQQRVGTYWIVYPFLNHGRRIAWDGMWTQGKGGHGRSFMSAIPDALIQRKVDQDMKIFCKNGSVIQIMGADKPDRFVGANPVGIVYSEYSLMDPLAWTLMAPVLRENQGWAVFIYTPRGMNHGYSLYKKALGNKDWFVSKLTCRDTRTMSREDLLSLREELGDEALFQQEMFCSFSAPMQGAYYANQIRSLYKSKQITPFLPADPMLEVHTAWDLGMNDDTCIWFYQKHRNEIRVIDFYKNNGESIAHYVNVLKEKSRDRMWSYGKHYGPWDLAIRDISVGVSRKETFRRLGLRIQPVKKMPKEDVIEAVRNILPRCWFNSETCSYGLDALKSFRKEYDDKHETFKSSPVHDWASHPADAFGVLAVAEARGHREKDPFDRMKERELTNYDPFDWLR